MRGWQAKKRRTCALPVDKGYARKCKTTRSAGGYLFEMFLSENKERPSFVAVRRHLPPGGKAISKAEIEISNDLKQSVMKHPAGAL